jgi:hypothetical protein
MRRPLAPFLLAALLAAACRIEHAPPPDSFSSEALAAALAEGHSCGITSTTPLTGDGIGDLRIGRTAEEVAEACDIIREELWMPEGMPSRVLVVDLLRDTVSAELVDGRVWRLTLRKPGFFTMPDSLGVGIRLSRLIRTDGLTAAVGEGSLWAMSPRLCGLSFEVVRRAPPPPAAQSGTAALRRLPGETRIGRVLVTGCGVGDAAGDMDRMDRQMGGAPPRGNAPPDSTAPPRPGAVVPPPG